MRKEAEKHAITAWDAANTQNMEALGKALDTLGIYEQYLTPEGKIQFEKAKALFQKKQIVRAAGEEEEFFATLTEICGIIYDAQRARRLGEELPEENADEDDDTDEQALGIVPLVPGVPHLPSLPFLPSLPSLNLGGEGDGGSGNDNGSKNSENGNGVNPSSPSGRPSGGGFQGGGGRSGGGGGGRSIDEVLQQESPRNPQLVDDKYLKRLGLDAHEIKQDVIGSKAPISHYDIYVDKNTGDLWVYEKGGKGAPIPTYINIKD